MMQKMQAAQKKAEERQRQDGTLDANATAPADASGTTKPEEFVAIDDSNWDALEAAALKPGGDVNVRDAEGSTVLLAAVRANAPLATVRKLVEGGASLVTANRRRETPIFHTRDPQVLEYLLDKLKGQFPAVVSSLVSEDKGAQLDAISTIYSVSFAEPRKTVVLPEELWAKVIHLLRVDPSNVTSAQPKEILCPLLVALCNFSFEDKYAAIVGVQPGSFAFLFGLACKHPSENVQKYAMSTLFSLSRNDKNKETITTKWFLVLAKLFSSSNLAIQTLAASTMAEISINNDEAKGKIIKEVGVTKIAALLSSPSQELRFEGSRLLTNITNKNADIQKSVVKDGTLALLIGIVTKKEDNSCKTRSAALSALANIIALLSDKEANMGPDFAKKENLVVTIINILKETTEGDNDAIELQEQNLRALVGITRNKPLSAEFIEKEGVEALVPLLHKGHKEIQKQSVRVIKNLSKKYKKRLGAKEALLSSLQSVMGESGSTKLQKTVKKTLSRLQLSSK